MILDKGQVSVAKGIQWQTSLHVTTDKISQKVLKNEIKKWPFGIRSILLPSPLSQWNTQRDSMVTLEYWPGSPGVICSFHYRTEIMPLFSNSARRRSETALWPVSSVVYEYKPLVVPRCQLFALDPFLTLFDVWFGLVGQGVRVGRRRQGRRSCSQSQVWRGWRQRRL